MCLPRAHTQVRPYRLSNQVVWQCTRLGCSASFDAQPSFFAKANWMTYNLAALPADPGGLFASAK